MVDEPDSNKAAEARGQKSVPGTTTPHSLEKERRASTAVFPTMLVIGLRYPER